MPDTVTITLPVEAARALEVAHLGVTDAAAEFVDSMPACPRLVDDELEAFVALQNAVRAWRAASEAAVRATRVDARLDEGDAVPAEDAVKLTVYETVAYTFEVPRADVALLEGGDEGALERLADACSFACRDELHAAVPPAGWTATDIVVADRVFEHRHPTPIHTES